MKTSQRVAVVTGASRGIGRAIALRLAQDGIKVAINYSSSHNEANRVVEEIQGFGGTAFCYQGDVTSMDEMTGLFDETLKKFEKVDILVNNAGITRDNLLLKMTEEQWDQVLEVNLKGVFNCTKACLRPMLKQRFGKIINIASVIGLTGNTAQGNYAAAKAGIIGFTKATAKELASRGITVNAVAPGFITTDMTTGLNENIQRKYLEQIPLRRAGRPEDVANAVNFLASSAAEYITGEVIRVDGGLAI